jgi:hypothetical protein
MNQLIRNATATAGALAFLALPAAADDLTGAEMLLCSAVKAVHCTAARDCESDLPWNLNIPMFLKIDLATDTMSTTEASGDVRATTMQSTTRGDGVIVLQGIDNGRAYSFMIVEETGLLSAAVARDGITVSVFGACTPST